MREIVNDGLRLLIEQPYNQHSCACSARRRNWLRVVFGVLFGFFLAQLQPFSDFVGQRLKELV